MTSPPPRLRIGLQLPVVEALAADGSRTVPRWHEILQLALLAEELGLDSLWIPDHLLMRRGEPPVSQGVWEGWSLVAALAAVTRRIEIGTLVLCTAFRDAGLLAEMAMTVDAISQGRLILGLGAGWHRPEFAAFGMPLEGRVDRFEAAIIAIRESLAAHERRIPLMVGTMGPRMLRIAARHADLWNTGLVGGRSWPDVIPPLRARVDAACCETGRDPDSLARTINPLLVFPIEGAEAIPAGAVPLSGPPDVIANALLGFAAEGIGHVQLLLNPNTLAGLRALLPVLRRLGR